MPLNRTWDDAPTPNATVSTSRLRQHCLFKSFVSTNASAACLLFWNTGTCNLVNGLCKVILQVQAAYLGGLRVPLKVLLSMRGSSTAYGPPSLTSTSKNCVSGGRSAADLPHSGVIHQSLHLAHARQRLECSCRQKSCCDA